jgi:hypothetical protein
MGKLFQLTYFRKLKVLAKRFALLKQEVNKLEYTFALIIVCEILSKYMLDRVHEFQFSSSLTFCFIVCAFHPFTTFVIMFPKKPYRNSVFCSENNKNTERYRFEFLQEQNNIPKFN